MDSGLPTKTLAPATTSSRSETTQDRNVADPPSSTSSEDPNHGFDSTTTGETVAATGAAGKASQPVPPKDGTTSPSDPGDNVASFIMSMFLPQGSQSSDVAGDPPLPPFDPAQSVGHGVVISAGSEVHTALSIQGSIILDGTPLADGQATVVSGQTISAKSDAVFVDGVKQHYSVLQHPSVVPSLPFTKEEPQTAGSGVMITAGTGVHSAVSSQGLVFLDGTPLADGQATVISGQTISIQSGIVHVNGIPQQASILERPPKLPGISTVVGQGDAQLTAVLAGAEIVVADDSITAFKDGADVLIAGATLTIGQVTTISGARISVASDGIVVGIRTATFHEMESSTGEAGAAVTIDGTVYSASAIPGDSNAVLLAGQTLSIGGTAVSIDGQVVTNGPNGISIVDPTAVASSEWLGTESVLTIDGTAYTATLVPGHSGAVVLQGHTLSVGGPAVTIADQLVTKGSDGISVTDVTSLTSVATSELPLPTNVSENITEQASPSSSVGESRAISARYGLASRLASFALLFLTLTNV